MESTEDDFRTSPTMQAVKLCLNAQQGPVLTVADEKKNLFIAIDLVNTQVINSFVKIRGILKSFTAETDITCLHKYASVDTGHALELTM